MDETVVFNIDCGYGGDMLTVYTDKVVIRHRGAINFLTMGLQGEKTIYFRNITSVQYRKPGLLAGYIQFSFAGGIESRKGVMEAAVDENTVTLNNKKYDYRRVIDYINHRIQAVTESVAYINNVSQADEMRKYKKLMDDGIITREEFREKKKKLLQQ